MIIKILIADPHPIVCMGIKTTMQSLQADFFETHRYMQAEEILTKHPITLAIIDSSMAGLAYHHDLYQLPGKFKHTRFIAHTCFFGPWLKDALLTSNFHALVSKNENKLMEAAESCLMGKRYVSPELQEEEDAIVKQSIAKPTVFTKQEMKILAMNTLGMNADELSYALDLKKNTIQSYRKRMLKKFKVKNMAELVDYAHRIGIM